MPQPPDMQCSAVAAFGLSPEVSIALANFISVISRADSEEQIYATLACSLQHMIPNHRASITLLNEQQDQLDVLCLHGHQGAIPLGNSLDAASSFTGQTALQQKPAIHYLDEQTSETDGRLLFSAGMNCIINAPLIVQNKPIGAINSAHQSVQGFNQQSVNLLELIAQLVSTHIERQRLLEEKEQAITQYRFYASQLENLNHLAKHLSKVTSVDETLQITETAIQKIIPSQRVSYAHYNAEHDHFEITVLCGDSPQKHMLLPAKDTGLEQVIKQQQPLYFDNLQQRQEHIKLHDMGLRSAWSLPVRVEGKVIATLNAASHDYDNKHPQLSNILGMLSAILGSVIERLNTRQQLIHQVNHDPVTGLPNRLLLNEHVAVMLLQRQQQPFALLFVDLDYFKEVNDSLGHQIGDELLELVGKRMQHTVRHNDVVARVGGDEFIVLLSDDSSARHSQETARRIIDSLSQPFEIKGETLNISASIGICPSAPPLSSPEEMIRVADMAMYQAKIAGRGTFVLSQPGDDSEQLDLDV